MTLVRCFSDLLLRLPEEIDQAFALQSGSYAAAVFDDRGTAESAAMMVDGEVDCVRWFADAPSDELHARHVSRYGGDTVLETWRYAPDGLLINHYVLENGRTVRGEEYEPDGTLRRTIGEE